MNIRLSEILLALIVNIWSIIVHYFVFSACMLFQVKLNSIINNIVSFKFIINSKKILTVKPTSMLCLRTAVSTLCFSVRHFAGNPNPVKDLAMWMDPSNIPLQGTILFNVSGLFTWDNNQKWDYYTFFFIWNLGLGSHLLVSLMSFLILEFFG